MSKCSNCGKKIENLPEGVTVPDPPETMTRVVNDPSTGVTVMESVVVHPFCRRCSDFILPTIRKYLKNMAKQ